MRRTLLLGVALALAVDGATARAQVTGGASGGTVRIRMRSPSDSATRARRERLLMRFDSLRYAFENERMTDAERERLATEMHSTVMALQQSLDGATATAFATTRASGAEREAAAMVGPIALAWQGYASRGYLGVSFDGPSVEEIRRGGERIIRFLDYPRIALVEPSSPAERAGILQGDTLLAFNGDDVRDKQISLTRLLVPDQRVVVRVRRDGDSKDFRVRIEEAPGYVMSRRTPMAPVAMPGVPPMPAVAPTPVRVYSGEDLPRRAPLAAVAMGPTPAGTSVWVMTEGVGGAKVETINEGLARTIGVRAGVLVLRVNPGTPAYRSGLRDGDVILRASGRQVNSVRELRALVESEDENAGVKLVIQRERRQRDIVLRW